MKTKGFSIIHCIILTVIIAILTAIIVPIVVNNSNSETAANSDEATVDLLNEALAASEEANGAPTTLCGVWAVLESAGYNQGVAPLYNTNEFWYYKTDNRIVMVADNVICYPAEYVNNGVYTNFENGPYINLNTLATDESAHDSSYASGTCSICGATNN